MGRDFAGTGRGLIAIATLFESGGDPGNSITDHNKLGRTIWGEAYGDPESSERERILSIIMTRFTPEEWVRLKGHERKGSDFADTGLGIMALGTLFGSAGDPANNSADHWNLGRAIWGKSWPRSLR